MNFSLHLSKSSLKYDPVVYIANLQEFERSFLRVLLEQAFYFPADYAAMQSLADRAGICRAYAFRAKKKFVEDGLIESTNRGIKMTCLRAVSSIFRDPSVVTKCRRLLGSIASKILAAMNDYIFSLFVDREKAEYARKVAVYTQRYSISINSISILSPSTKKLGGLTQYRVGDLEPGGDMITQIMGKRLTEYGQIKLSAYPEKIVNLVNQSIKYPQNITSPMAYFETRCRKECANRAIRPDYDYVKQLCLVKGFTQETPVFESTNLPILSATPKRETKHIESPEETTARLTHLRNKMRQEAQERAILREARLNQPKTSDNTVVPTGSIFDPSYWMSILGKERA